MDIDPSQERFEIEIPVADTDIDRLDHVNNVVYLRWVQEAATSHWQAAATPKQQEEVIWVVMRHEIDYKLSAKRGETIIARTWVGTATQVAFDRHTEILRASDRKLLARARTVWCPIDTKTGRPARVGQDIRDRFSVPVESVSSQ